jgi:hypothetical protein
MLGVASTTSSSSSSLGGSTASDSAPASPPYLDMVISSAIIVARSELPMIPELMELDATQPTMEQEGMGPIDLAFLCRW